MNTLNMCECSRRLPTIHTETQGGIFRLDETADQKTPQKNETSTSGCIATQPLPLLLMLATLETKQKSQQKCVLHAPAILSDNNQTTSVK